MEFELHFKQPQTREIVPRGDDSPMRILVMGDFSGRANRGVENFSDLSERPFVRIDVDNFEDVLFRFAPQLFLPIDEPAGPSMVVEFKSLDDFHPDRLFRQLEVFEALRETRGRLSDPEAFAQAAAELRHEAVSREPLSSRAMPSLACPQRASIPMAIPLPGKLSLNRRVSASTTFSPAHARALPMCCLASIEAISSP